MVTNGHPNVYQWTPRRLPKGTPSCLPEGTKMFTKGHPNVYWRAPPGVYQRGPKCLPKGTQTFTKGHPQMFTRGHPQMFTRGHPNVYQRAPPGVYQRAQNLFRSRRKLFLTGSAPEVLSWRQHLPEPELSLRGEGRSWAGCWLRSGGAGSVCAAGPTCRAEGLCVWSEWTFFCHPVWEPVQDLFLLAVSCCCEYISAFLKASAQLKG